MPKLTQLDGYRDAVVSALLGAGIGVGDNETDATAPLIGIDLDPVGSQTPVMLWTPGAGWRVAVTERGRIQARTIRYVHAGPVPSPAYVAESVRRWLTDSGVLSDVAPSYELSPGSLAGRLADAVGPVEMPRPLSHVLIDGAGCPSWCRTDHEHEKTNPYSDTVRHNGRTMRVGGVDVFPAIHVDARARSLAVIPPTGPRMRVVLDGEADEVPPNIVYFGLRNAGRMAKLLDLAGDTSGLSNAIRAAVAALDTESQAAANIAAERREQMEAAAR